MSATVTAIRPPTQAPAKIDVSGYDGPDDDDGAWKMAERLASAKKTVPSVYKDSPGDAYAAILQARAVNIPVMTAVHHLYWGDDGTPGLSAQLMGALLRRGGATWTFAIVPSRSCTIVPEFTDGRPAEVVEYTMTDAVVAGIAGSEHWQRTPDDMLYARAVARMARQQAQDMLLGLCYLPDELAERRAAPLTPEKPVSDEVKAFLTEVAATDGLTAAAVQKLIEKVRTKKVNLAGEYAGGGQTVEEHLQALWRQLVGKEAAQIEERVTGAAPPPGEPLPSSVATPTPADDAPAGTGKLTCDCPAWAVLSDGKHLATCNDPSTPRG